jgi:tetratricopeptide (TPR) repeat protein
VFISSARGEGLAPYRSAAIEVVRRLGMIAVCMEDFSPEGQPPIALCREKVASSDVLVLLVGHRYGSRPAGRDASYTELEYQWAHASKNIQVVPFVIDPSFPWPPLDIDRDTDEKSLKAFINAVKSQNTTRSFGDVNQFREDLIVALRPFEVGPEQDKPPKPGHSARNPIPEPPAFHPVPPYVGSAPFTGRVEQLAELDAWAAARDAVMVVEAIGGTGKSALTWHWATTRADSAIDGFAGGLWWSFYEGSASMTRFLQEVLAYTTRRRWSEIWQLSHRDLCAAVLTALRERPYLLVLDGFERLLTAYHVLDPSKLRDEDVVTSKRSLIEPQAHDALRALTAAGPSKILISTRLMPYALEGRFGQRIPDVSHVRLPGLTDADTIDLLASLGVYGDQKAINAFFRQLDNHPLIVGIVAGLVRDYRRHPRSFDRWRADPTAGGAFRLTELNLTQRQSHILATALDDLDPGHRLLLGYIAEMAGAVDWATLDAINPFLPEPPELDDDVTPRERVAFLAKWRESEPVTRARAQLDLALKDLEERGLLWWEKPSNTYDLHPIVRAVAHDQLDEGNRIRANERITEHFEALPDPEDSEVSSVEELQKTITLFRALVGAGRFTKAARVWEGRLSAPILVELGATATAIELLEPLASFDGFGTHGVLAVAMYQAGRFTDTLRHATIAFQMSLESPEVLDDEGQPEDPYMAFHNVIDPTIELGRLATATRYLDLYEQLSDTGRDRSSARQRGIIEAKRGESAAALALFWEAPRLESHVTEVWFDSEVRYGMLYVAAHTDPSFTEELLDAADAEASAWLERRNLKRLRRDFLIKRGQLEQALKAAQECDRMEQDSGVETAPAATAYLLAALGRTSEATEAVEEALDRLPRLDSAVRPYYYLGRTLHALGRSREAVDFAHRAYEQAWGEGRPYCNHWDLINAEALLADLGEEPPGLPDADLSALQVPLEQEIRALIAQRLAQRRDDEETA